MEECLDRPRDPLPTRVESCPPLPAAYDDSLDAALAALGLTLRPAVRAAIDGQVRLLLAWNAAINLTSVRDPATVAVRHVADSLTALGTLQAAGIDAFLDLGSGGGYPGIPLAAALPSAEALLVDSVGKKARFLDVAVNAVGLAGRVRVGSVRAEALAADRRHRECWPAVTARAVAPLAELVELAFPLLAPGGLLIAWKRGEIGLELAAAQRAIEVLGGGSIEVRPATGVDQPARADPAGDVGSSDPAGNIGSSDPARRDGLADLDGHCLVLVRRGRQAVPAAYPRDPADRRRRPW
jgi:16S rRNA (guanine527-N7)-methyltransferase